MQVYQGDCDGDQIHQSSYDLHDIQPIFTRAVSFQYLFPVTLLWGGTREWGGLPGEKKIVCLLCEEEDKILGIHKMFIESNEQEVVLRFKHMVGLDPWWVAQYYK